MIHAKESDEICFGWWQRKENFWPGNNDPKNGQSVVAALDAI
jgi:hypothetical protein